ncbi:MAG: DUF2069 domain-containing protein [Burkholderiaceae bacterium]|nr:DUF2069 domain-containing protein [Burkholderiaceae bacterium]
MSTLSPSPLRRIIVACFVALIVLGIAWETWLAPLRPGAWLLSLKTVPLVLALPGIAAGRLRVYQWWSMLILGYLTEGVVRTASDAGLAARLATVEIALAVVAFTSIVLYVRAVRREAA